MTKLGERLIKSTKEALAIAEGKMKPGRVIAAEETDVARIRKRLNLSQGKFAGRFHLSAATIRDWEQKRRNPDRIAMDLPRFCGEAFGSTGGQPFELGGRVDKSRLVLGEPRRVRDKDHLRHVAAHACVLCGATPADAHHIRYAQPKALGAKASDEFTVPLCRAHHRELHDTGNERAWWHDMGLDPLPLARRLWKESHGGKTNNQDGGKGAGSTQQTMPAPLPTVPAPDSIGADKDGRQH